MSKNNLELELSKFKNFSIILKDEVVSISPTLSKGRALIFYKYSNRNGTYITDEFAEKLLSTVPYTPVKGIFSTSENDFTDHGKARDLGQIYGIVSATPNLAWEDHLDEDGVTRTYAAVDVFLYTAIYKEAGEIVNKSLSMELYEPSLQGSFTIIQGRRQFVYTDGCFLGLQVLGEEVKPCFEGAGFYSLYEPIYDSLKNLLNELKSYTLITENKLIGEEDNMPQVNFKLSDNQKYMELWKLINVNYNDEGGWVVDYSVEEIYDEYALCYNYEEHQYYRYYYTKDDETDTVTLGQKKKCYIIEVTEEEKNALDALHAIRDFSDINTYVEGLETEKAIFTEKETTLNTTIETLNASVAEKDATIASLNTTIEEVNGKLTTAEENYTALETEANSLKEYKLQIELNEKEAVISNYADLLSEEVIKPYQESIANYTVVQLEEKLAYEYMKTNTSLFSKSPKKTGYVASNSAPLTGVEAILSKYENQNK